MEIKGIRGYFNDVRIDRTTVPEGFHIWELADGDCDGTPCRYKPGILVNFYGTFITTGKMPVDEPEWEEGFIHSDDEWGYMDCGNMSLSEVVQCEKGEQGHGSKNNRTNDNGRVF
jgi:hypothetical protein